MKQYFNDLLSNCPAGLVLVKSCSPEKVQGSSDDEA